MLPSCKKRDEKMDNNSEKKITVELNVDEFKKLQELLELDEKNEQDQQKKENEKRILISFNFIEKTCQN